MELHPFEHGVQLVCQEKINQVLTTARDMALPDTTRCAAIWSILWRPIEEFEEDQLCRLIVEFLNDSSRTAQRIAISACRRLDATDEILSILWPIAKCRSDNSRYALRTLAQFGEREVVDVCKPILQHGSHSEQIGAAMSLGFLRSEEALDVLESAFKGTLPKSVRFPIACGISKCGGKSATAFLEEFSREAEDGELIFCLCALSAQGSTIGKRKLKALLQNAVSETREQVRIGLRAFFILTAEGPNWLPNTLKWLSSDS